MWRTIRFTPLKVESKKQRVEHYYEGNHHDPSFARFAGRAAPHRNFVQPEIRIGRGGLRNFDSDPFIGGLSQPTGTAQSYAEADAVLRSSRPRLWGNNPTVTV